MNPIFTLQYGEFSVADTLSKKLKNISVFVPASSQEKGIDLLLYRHENGKRTTLTVQVKMSRTYINVNPKYENTLWFNRFEPQENADWFILTGMYAAFPKSLDAAVKEAQWNNIMLAFTYNEMVEFMDEVRQKKDKTKVDKMFGFGFNCVDEIFQTRGYGSERDMSKYLLENRLDDIEKSFY